MSSIPTVDTFLNMTTEARTCSEMTEHLNQEFLERVEGKSAQVQIDNVSCGYIFSKNVWQRFKRLLHKHSQRIATTRFDVGQIPGAEFHIRLKSDATTRTIPQRRQPANHEREISRQMKLLEAQGHIREARF